MPWHTVDRFESQNGPGQLRVFSLDDNDVRDHDHAEHYTVSPTEPLLVSEGQKQLSFHWLPDRRTARVIVPEEFGEVADLAFSREGKDVRLLSMDGKLAQVILADPDLTFQTLRKIEVLPDAILRFAPDGEHIVSRESHFLPKDDQVESSNQWWFAVYDLRASRVAQRRVTNSPSYRPSLMDGSKVLDRPVLETDRQPDGQQMLARGNDGSQWLRYRGEAIEPVPTPRSVAGPWHPTLVPGTGLLAYTLGPSSASGDPRAVEIEVMDPSQNIMMRTRYMSEYAADWMARTFKAEPGAKSWVLSSPPSVNTGTLTASPDGRYVATADLSRNIRLWDLKTSDTDWRASGHSGRVMHLQFTPDGSRLITIGEDRVVKHRSVETGEELKSSLMPDPGTTEFWLCTSGSGDRVLLCPLKRFGGEPYHTFNGCYVWDLNRSKVLFDGRALGGGRCTSHAPRFL